MKFSVPHVIEQGDERIPVAIDIAQDDRLVVPVELRPGGDLDQFFERADAARQGHESVGALEHRHLALMHVGRDDQFVDVRQHPLARHQEFRDDAGHMPAGRQGRARHFAHQSQAAAAIDETDPFFGERLAEFAGGFDIGRIAARVPNRNKRRDCISASSLPFRCKSRAVLGMAAFAHCFKQHYEGLGRDSWRQ